MKIAIIGCGATGQSGSGNRSMDGGQGVRHRRRRLRSRRACPGLRRRNAQRQAVGRARVGVAAPVNATLTALVKSIERRWDTSELGAE
ncbi:hypothetical protein MSIMFI_00473 [Mycobacterium simulans]|nr:hypothetical protein MSIMFI_00473 [Mycobacterium simulans]